MLTLTTTSRFDDVERLVDRIANMGNGESRKIADGIRQEFQRNFTQQGSGAGRWAALAPSTVLDRQKQGYGGGGPILVRTGQLRASYVQRGGDNHESIQSGSGGLVIEVGSNHPRAIFHEAGTRTIPQRSVVTLGEESESNLVRLIDFVVDQIERREWR
jgi:phage gpG-like protein